MLVMMRSILGSTTQGRLVVVVVVHTVKGDFFRVKRILSTRLMWCIFAVVTSTAVAAVGKLVGKIIVGLFILRVKAGSAAVAHHSLVDIV